MKLPIFLFLLYGTIKIVFPEKHCMVTTSKLSCTYDPTEERSLSIQKTDIRTLDLSGRIMADARSYVKDYRNLEELTLSNCRIRTLDNGTFAELSKLIKMNLSDNLMTSFNRYSFDRVNVLNILILSNNLLDDLNDLQLEAFPKLRVLDVSGNQLEYLPVEIIHKLWKDSTFPLYISNNPWNCDHPHWKEYLEMNADWKKRFCMSPSNSYVDSLKYEEEKTHDKVSVLRENCGFIKCKWWIIGSVWIGVVLGNLNKLNKLLFRSRCKRKRVFEKAVGTEMEVHHMMRQDRIAFGVEDTEIKSKN